MHIMVVTGYADLVTSIGRPHDKSASYPVSAHPPEPSFGSPESSMQAVMVLVNHGDETVFNPTLCSFGLAVGDYEFGGNLMVATRRWGIGEDCEPKARHFFHWPKAGINQPTYGCFP
jgi:hypothetical protein